MKPKYYPHMTALGAVILTVAPLVLVLSLSALRTTEDESLLYAGNATVDSLNSKTLTVDESAVVAEHSSRPAAAPPNTPPAALRHSDKGAGKSVASVATNQSVATNELRRETRVAFREPEYPAAPPSIADPTAQSQTRIPTAVNAGTSVADPDKTSAGKAIGSPAENPVPAPRTMPAADVAGGIVPPVLAVVAPQKTISPAPGPAASVGSVASGIPSAAPLAEPSDPDMLLEPVVIAKTPFEATGHLSLMGGTQGAITTGNGSGARNTAGSSDKMPSATDMSQTPENTLPESGRRSRSVRRTESARKQSDEGSDDAELRRAMAGVADPNVPGFGAVPQAQLEDIVLQQPLETRPVDRVENLVAVTKAAGWPIALVRSDLPDDQWWVQQMVGIRGNAFAARVNFGNEYSIAGSVYHMVIVFLDSPEEVRRFRIAKQFKELPEGIRRSREFTFVRR